MNCNLINSIFDTGGVNTESDMEYEYTISRLGNTFFVKREGETDIDIFKAILIEKFKSLKSSMPGSINTVNIDYVIETIKNTEIGA